MYSTFLLQVFNKLLTLASTASQTNEFSLWNNLLISTSGVSVQHLLLHRHLKLERIARALIGRNGDRDVRNRNGV